MNDKERLKKAMLELKEITFPAEKIGQSFFSHRDRVKELFRSFQFGSDTDGERKNQITLVKLAIGEFKSISLSQWREVDDRSKMTPYSFSMRVPDALKHGITIKKK